MASIPFTADVPPGGPASSPRPGTGRRDSFPLPAAPASGWLRLRAVAEAAGVPIGTVRDQARRLPSHARRKVGREVEIDSRFLPPDLRGKLAEARRPKPNIDPTTWRRSDVARNQAITNILSQRDAEFARWVEAEPRLTDRTADERFARRHGDGSLGLRFSVGTLRRWRSRRRNGLGFKEGRGRKHGARVVAMGAAARARFLGEWLNAGKPITVCYEITAGEARRHAGDPAWHWPSEATVRRWLKSDHPEFYNAIHRKGWRRWRAQCEPKMVRDQHDLNANSLWEMDGSPGDYFVRFNGRIVRPAVVIVIDVATNLVVGWSVSPSESAEAVLKAFRRAIERYGVPLAVRTDLGKAFLAESVADARGARNGYDAIGIFEALNVRLETCIGKSPWQKGSVEAMFNGFRQRYAPLHGKAFIGNSHKSRPDTVDAWCKKHPEKLKTLDEDDALVGKFWEAENRRPRRHLFNASPLQKFQATAIDDRRLPGDCPAMLNFLFARVRRVKVTDRGVGVSFGHTKIYYGQQDPRVWELVGREVVARIPADNAASIWLCDRKGRSPILIANDECRGVTPEALREAGKRKQRARKAVKTHWKNVDVAHAHPIDMALTFQCEFAEAQAAKVADKMPARKRSKTYLVTPAATDLRQIQQEHLRMAAGAEGISSPAGPSLSDLSRGMVSRDPIEDSGPSLRDLVPPIGKEAEDDEFQQRLLEG